MFGIFKQYKDNTEEITLSKKVRDLENKVASLEYEKKKKQIKDSVRISSDDDFCEKRIVLREENSVNVVELSFSTNIKNGVYNHIVTLDEDEAEMLLIFLYEHFGGNK